MEDPRPRDKHSLLLKYVLLLGKLQRAREVAMSEAEDFAQREVNVWSSTIHNTLKCTFKKLTLFLQSRNLRGGDTGTSKAGCWLIWWERESSNNTLLLMLLERERESSTLLKYATRFLYYWSTHPRINKYIKIDNFWFTWCWKRDIHFFQWIFGFWLP